MLEQGRTPTVCTAAHSRPPPASKDPSQSVPTLSRAPTDPARPRHLGMGRTARAALAVLAAAAAAAAATPHYQLDVALAQVSVGRERRRGSG